jgi:hypothetical protein
MVRVVVISKKKFKLLGYLFTVQDTHVLISTKHGVGLPFWVIFFANASGHPGDNLRRAHASAL